MGAHSSIGPSSAERWFNCAGSVALSAKAPPDEGNEYASEGTFAHTFAEELVTGKATVESLTRRVGEVVMVGKFPVTIIDEMVEGAVEYLDLIKDDIDILRRTNGSMEVVYKAEQKVIVKSADPEEEELWGTADFFLYKRGKKLIVYDYKFGQGVTVSPEENKQAVIYAIGAMETEAGEAFDEIEVVIHQPRARSGDPISRWIIPKDWLAEFRKELPKRVQATRDPNAKLRAGSWCRFCPAKSVCPVIYDAVQSEAKVDFDIVPQQAAASNVELLTVEKLVAAKAYEEMVKTFFEGVNNRIYTLLEQKVDVPGYKLVDKKANRVWINEQRTAEILGVMLPDDKLYKKKLLSPKQAEDAIGKKTLTSMNLWKKPPAGHTIAPIADPRQAAKNNAAEDFENIPGAVSITPKAEIAKKPYGVGLTEHTTSDLAAELMAGAPTVSSDELMGELMGTDAVPADAKPIDAIWPTN